MIASVTPEAALNNKPGLLDIVVAGAGFFGPAGDFLDFTKTAISAARADSGAAPAPGGSSSGKSAYEWLEDGAGQGIAVGKPLADFYSKLKGAVASDADCQASPDCKAFIFEVEAHRPVGSQHHHGGRADGELPVQELTRRPFPTHFNSPRLL